MAITAMPSTTPIKTEGLGSRCATCGQLHWVGISNVQDHRHPSRQLKDVQHVVPYSGSNCHWLPQSIPHPNVPK